MKGKYHDLKRTYNELYHIYSGETFWGRQKPEDVADAMEGVQWYE